MLKRQISCGSIFSHTHVRMLVHVCVVLQDAPVEEANVVEKILSHRIRPTTEAELHLGETIEEFFVKYKN